MRTAVAIVGGGPVGLSLALILATNGISVVLLEKEQATAKEQRGAAFHPPSLEMLNSLGLTSELLPKGVKVPVWQIRDQGGVIAEFDLGLLSDETAYPFRFHMPQHVLSEALLARLKDTSATLLHGQKVTQITQHKDRVEIHYVDPSGATQMLDATWVVGADGAHSVVRKQSDIDFEGFSWPERFLVTNVTNPMDTHGFTGASYVSDPENWGVVLKLADSNKNDLWRIAMPVLNELPDEQVLDGAYVQSRLNGLFSVNTPFSLTYANTYRVHQRVARQFRNNRIFLAGDAAHINNPLGGFGLNGGLHDAFNLAEHLIQAANRGENKDPMLDRYERQRRHVAVEHVQSQSIRNKRQLEEKDPVVRAEQRRHLASISGDVSLAKKYLLETSMISSVRQAAEIA